MGKIKKCNSCKDTVGEDVFVSVIMPTYNTEEEYLKKSIESVLKQTHSNFEFIITVDGSTNNDLKIVSMYAKKDDRVIVINNGINRGLVYSLNNMIAHSSGKYIFRMDADDISFHNRLEKAIIFMENHPNVDICGSQVRYLYDGKVKRRTFLPCDDQSIKWLLAISNAMAHPTVVFRKKSIGNQVLYNSNEKSEDYNLWVDSYIKGLTFSNINTPLLYYRIHQKQTISKYKRELIDSGMRIRKKLYNHLHINSKDDDIVLLSRFLQATEKISHSDITKISRFLVLIGDSFKDPKPCKEFYAHFFSKRLFLLKKNKLVNIGNYRDYSIMHYGSWYDKLLVLLCSVI